MRLENGEVHELTVWVSIVGIASQGWGRGWGRASQVICLLYGTCIRDVCILRCLLFHRQDYYTQMQDTTTVYS